MTDAQTFEKFPSMGRLSREVIYTEKLDGTNAQILIDDDGNVTCGSPKRWITPEVDNYGFARWVHDNIVHLVDLLGPGRHYGEWWGQGIQKRQGYGLDHKRFSLFNVERWGDVDLFSVPQLHVVPELHRGSIDGWRRVADILRENGSAAAPGFMKPEGIVAFHRQANVGFKYTFEGDDLSKWQIEQGQS